MMRLFSTKRMRFGLVSVLVSLLILSFSVFNVQAATVGITVDVTTDTGGAGCELREAIQSANSEVAQPGCTFSVAPTGGADDFVITIDYITIGSPVVINLNSELPSFQQPIHLIGGDVTTFPADVTIQPAGSAGTLSYGLRIGATAGDSRIQGMAIDGFTVGIEVVNTADNPLLANNTQIGLPVGAGGNKLINNETGILIRGANSDNISVEGNLIGLDDIFALPITTAGNSLDGIRVVDAQNIVIGSAVAPNFVGANGRNGIFIDNVDNIDIVENFIGRALFLADEDVGNGQSGIRVIGGSNTVLIDGNIIGSNGGNGIGMISASNAIISNNFIGETPAGDIAGNGRNGVWIGANNVQVTGNLIAHNGVNGVNVNNGIRNEISQNSIFNNARLGIDLDNDGVTLNDAGDPDTGPNGLQNYPGVSAAWIVGATLFIDGYMNSVPGTYTIEIYNNPGGCNTPTGTPRFGEGEVYEQSVTVGPGPFSLSLGVGGFVAGDTMTLLAIASNGSTSEFSPCVIVLAAPPTATPTNTPTNTPAPVITTLAPVVTTTVPPVVTDPSDTPTFTHTFTPTFTHTFTPTFTRTPTHTFTPTFTRTPTHTFTPTFTRTPTHTFTPTFTRTPTHTFTPTFTHTVTFTPTFTLTPTGTPDIDITKVSDGDDDVQIDIVNNGDNTAPDVIVIEDLRDDVEYRAAVAGGAACIESAGIVTCYVGDIPAGATAQVNINVNGNGVDPASGETTVTVGGVTVAIVDEPYIIKVGNPPVAAPGAEIVYTIRVINPTTESAFQVLIEDEMPEGIEIISGTATDGELVIDGQSVTLSLDELVAGGRVTITLVTRVSDAEIFPQIVNTACVTSSSNPAPRCAQMSFLRAGELPITGETPLIYQVLQWLGIALMTGLSFSGLFLFWRRSQRA